MAPEVICCKFESRRAKLNFRGRYTIFRLLEYEMKDAWSAFMLFKLSSSRHRYSKEDRELHEMKILLVFVVVLAVVAATTDGYNQHKGYTRTRTRPTTDGKHHPVYCPKPNPPVYGYIKENNAYYHIGSIIHYYCNYGYELYGSSWNKCVYEYGVAKWEYPVPICKPKVYSG